MWLEIFFFFVGGKNLKISRKLQGNVELVISIICKFKYQHGYSLNNPFWDYNIIMENTNVNIFHLSQ